MRLVLLALVGLVACGRVAEDPPRPREAWETAGGTRLRPIFATAPGGVRSFVAFEDRLRGQRCLPQTWDDELVCAPLLITARAFADPTCTEPAAGLDERCDGTPRLIMKDGVTFTAKPIERAYSTDGLCTPLEAPPGARWVVPGDRVTAADFVAFRKERLDVGGRLQVTVLIGEDGSRHVSRFLWDSQLQAECSFGAATDGSRRCIPRDEQLAWDETCTFRVVSVRAEAAAPGAASVAEGCGYRVHRATGPITTRVSRRKDDGSCVPVPSGATRAARIEEELSPSDLAPESKTEVGDGRLRQTVHTVGAARLPDVLHDRELGDDCYRVNVGGAYRCLPGNWTPFSFADARCSGADAFVCAPPVCPPTRFVWQEAPGRCDFQVREIGARVELPASVYVRSGGKCVPGLRTGCTSSVQLGPALPPTAFASLTEIVE